MLVEEGDGEGARSAYQQAIDSGNPHYAALAANNLGNVLSSRHDEAGAEQAYRLSADLGDAKAARNLAYLYTRQGRFDQARPAYQAVIDSGDPELAPKAMITLGTLLTQRGDLAGARTCFRRALDAGHPEYARKAARLLADLPEPT